MKNTKSCLECFIRPRLNIFGFLNIILSLYVLVVSQIVKKNFRVLNMLHFLFKRNQMNQISFRTFRIELKTVKTYQSREITIPYCFIFPNAFRVDYEIQAEKGKIRVFNLNSIVAFHFRYCCVLVQNNVILFFW